MMLSNLRLLLAPSSPLYVPLRFDLNLIRWLWRFHRASSAAHVHRATEILCRLGRASVDLFDSLASEFDFSYRRAGRLEVCRQPGTLQAILHEAELYKSFGFDYRQLTPEEVAEFEPAIIGPVVGAVHIADSCFCEPEQFVLELAKAAQRKGVEIHTGLQVTDLEVQSESAVRVITDAQPIDARRVVLACGAWAPRLEKRLGLRLPVQPGKGYHLDLELPDDATIPKIPFVVMDDRTYIIPYDGFVRLAGTMEFSGFNLRQHPARLQMLNDVASRYIEGVDRATVRSQWCHLRPMSPDGLPIIGPAPTAPNVWLATGHGMLGLTQGPITGKLIADALVDGRVDADLAVMRPDRF
jgi:D-amino-acid dehydrogenase